MVSFIGIDYLNNKFKVDMKHLTVSHYDAPSDKWNKILYSNVSTFTSKFNSSNTLDFLFNTYTFRVEVSTIGLAVTVTVRDNTTGKIYLLPENNFNYSSSSLEDLFTINDNGIYVLSDNIFYNITNDMIDVLSDERKTFFIRYCVNNVKAGETPAECYNKFCNTLSELVFKTNPEFEINFNNET